jgi:hypothetical protein
VVSVQAPGGRNSVRTASSARARVPASEDGVVKSGPLPGGRLAMSDETLVDVAPSPLRPRLQAGGERVVSLLVVRPGVPVR